MEKLKSVYENPDNLSPGEWDTGWRAKIADAAVRIALRLCGHSVELGRVKYQAAQLQLDADHRLLDDMHGDLIRSHRYQIDAEQQIEILKQMVKNRQRESQQQRERIQALEAITAAQAGKITNLEHDVDWARRDADLLRQQLHDEMIKRASNFR